MKKVHPPPMRAIACLTVLELLFLASAPAMAQDVAPVPRHFTVAGLGELAATIHTGEEYAVAAAAAAGDFDEDGRSDVLLRLAPRDVTAGSHDLVVLLYGEASRAQGTVDLLDRSTRTSIIRTGHFRPEDDGRVGMGGGEDVNGDGRPDLLVVSGTSPEFGAAMVALVFGGDRVLPRELDVTSVGVDFAGTTVTDQSQIDPLASVGAVSALSPDINGDGLGEVLIGETARGADRRRCFILFGSGSLPEIVDLRDIGASVPGLVLELDPALSRTGIRSVSSVGDIDGDGLAETSVRTLAANRSNPVFLLFGSTRFRDVIRLDPESFAGVDGIVLRGYDRLARGGDVDGDGFGEVILSQSEALRLQGLLVREAHVLYGRPRGALPEVIDRTLFRSEKLGTTMQVSRTSSGSLEGPEVRLSGGEDVDGDGLDDVFLSAPYYSNSYGDYTFQDAGAAFLLFGGDDLPESISAEEIADGSGFRLDGTEGAGRLGSDVVALRDFDGDGTGDILLTSRLDPCAVDPFVRSDQREALLVSGRILLDQDPEPRLGGVVPRIGPIQGDRVALLGRGFDDTTRVWFGESMAEVDQVVGGGVLLVRAPPGDLPVDVPIRIETDRGETKGDVRYGYVRSRELSVLDDGASSRRLTIRHAERDFGLRGVVVGDFNGDAKPDVALLDRTDEVQHLHLVFGQERRSGDVDLDALSSPRGVTIQIPSELFVSHRQLSGGGDLNADGFDDLVLGLFDLGDWAGDYRVILGRDAFPDGVKLETLSSTIRITHRGDLTQEAAAIVPDVSGDGVDELLLTTSTDTARLFVIQGRSDFPAEFALEEALAEDGRAAVYRSKFYLGDPVWGPELRFLEVAGAAGDFNGDGVDDVFFGGDGRFAEGAVAILYGGPAMFPGRPIELDQSTFGDGLGVLVTANSIVTGTIFAAAVPGDLDGDGDPELLFRYDNVYACAPTPRSGGAYVVDREAMLRHGFPADNVTTIASMYGPLSARPDFTPALPSPAEQEGVLEIRSGLRAEGLAISVSPAGDFNADGIVDVVIGTGRQDDGLGTEKAYIVFGAPDLLDRSLIDLVNPGDATLTLNGAGIRGFGNFVGGGFDWDGDGVSDIVVGSDVARADIVFGEPLLEVQFVRGDADGDSTATIADAILGLSYLFSGGARPACLDALDVDDDGRILVNDAIHLLSFLFQAGPPPEPPYPDPGPDPTADELSCAR